MPFFSFNLIECPPLCSTSNLIAVFHLFFFHAYSSSLSQICLSLVKLLFYLAHSPLGSIALLDFQPRQFVMVDGNLKVTDMDDASTEELSCKEDNDCTLDFPTKSFPLKCSVAGKCEGINEKKNLFNAYRYVQLHGGRFGVVELTPCHVTCSTLFFFQVVIPLTSVKGLLRITLKRVVFLIRQENSAVVVWWE